MKPIKRGYKLWMRADMDGYISKFDIYQGKAGKTNDSDAPKYFGLGEKVVHMLTADLYGKAHEVYCDNYFSSVPLMEYLLINEVYCCGTIRSNRKYLPVDMKSDKKLTRGEHDQRVSRQGLCFFKWMDSKAVNIISNFHGTEKATVQ